MSIPLVVSRRVVVGLLAATTALLSPQSARAAWGPSHDGPQSASGVALVSGGEPGSVGLGATVVGADDSISLAAVAHAPAGWTSTPGLTGDDEFDPIWGTGGAAFSLTASGVTRVLQLTATGALVDVGQVTATDVFITAAATDLAGGVVVAGTDESDRLVVFRSGAGAALAKLPVPAGVTAENVSVAGRPGGGVTIVWSTASGTIESGVVSGSSFTRGPRIAGSGPGSDVTLLRAVGGAQPAAVWVTQASDTADQIVRGAATAGTPAVLGTASARGVEGVSGVILGDGTLQAAWAAIVPRAASSAQTAGANAAGLRTCLAALPVSTLSDLVLRDGAAALAGVSGAGVLTAVKIDPNCGVEAVTGPVVGSAEAVAATVDAEGTLAAAVARDGAPTVLAADDRVAPAVTDPAIAGDLKAGASASASAGDAWHGASLSWAVDGSPVGTGATVAVPPLPIGDHTIRVAATDAAGNAREASSVVSVTADSAPQPTTPLPTTPNAPAPAEPTPPAAVSQPIVVAPTVPQQDDAPEPRDPRPIVTLRSLRRGADGVWRATVSVRHADRVRLTLYRERFKRGQGKRPSARKPTCGAPTGAPHEDAGKQGRVVERAKDGRVVIKLPNTFQRALSHRGRYRLRVLGYQKADPGRSSFDETKVTVC